MIQTYSIQILEDNNNERNTTTLDVISRLYSEMVLSNVKPSIKSTQSLLDASAVFRDYVKLSNSILLARQGRLHLFYG